VDRDSELPLGSQIAWKLRGLIAAGSIGLGERLPSVRELATAADVNVNTARAVYRRLEDEGYIVSRHGAGTFVADGAPATAEIERLAAESLAEARASGLDPRDLAAAIYASAGVPQVPGRMSSTPLPPAPTVPSVEQGDDRDARRELRRQIARLEAELGTYAERLRRRESTTHPLLRAAGHVAGVTELEATRDRLLSELGRVRSDEVDRAESEREARDHLEEMLENPDAHKWQWVSNEDIGEKGCRYWHTRPRFGVLGAMMGWWRVKVSSGCPLAGA